MQFVNHRGRNTHAFIISEMLISELTSTEKALICMDSEVFYKFDQINSVL